MGAMSKADNDGQILEAKFDAFKFPTSDVVQFKALVAPCLPACEPIKCSISGMDGRTSEVHSYGKRRRKRDADEVMVVQSLSVSDKMGFQRSLRRSDDDKYTVTNESKGKSRLDYSSYWYFKRSLFFCILFSDERYVEVNSCRNMIGISFIVLAFILAQTVLIITYACLWSAKRREKALTNGREWPQSHLIAADNFNHGVCNEFMYPPRKHYWDISTILSTIIAIFKLLDNGFYLHQQSLPSLCRLKTESETEFHTTRILTKPKGLVLVSNGTSISSGLSQWAQSMSCKTIVSYLAINSIN